MDPSIKRNEEKMDPVRINHERAVAHKESFPEKKATARKGTTLTTSEKRRTEIPMLLTANMKEKVGQAVSVSRGISYQ